jgi:hypothetical protein
MLEHLRRPLPWAFVSGAALLAALALPARASGLLFWGLTGLSCLGAALVVWFGQSAES